ncbi:MAG: glycerophosphodiester phosphodiesterase [Sciscionella sp.]
MRTQYWRSAPKRQEKLRETPWRVWHDCVVPPVVVAHRGASAHRAEHTLASYDLAIQQGAEALECDVRLTRDGHLVCVHDRRVDRTSTGRGVVSELTLERMAELDYGRWHDELPESADDLLAERVTGGSSDPAARTLMTLDALLGLVADNPGTKLFVETKHPVRYSGIVEAELVALLSKHGFAEPASSGESIVFAMSFSSAAMRRMRHYAPRVPTVLLVRQLSAARREGSLPRWADITGPGIRLLRVDPGYVARAAAHGNDTYCWTVDDPADIELCARLGVHYIATNSPVTTRKLLGG